MSGARPAGASATTLEPGDSLPDVQVAELSGELEGRQASGSLLRELDGPTVLFLFTSTCPYCARSFPFARTLQRRLDSVSVDLVGVALDGLFPGAGKDGTLIVPYRVLAPVDLAAAKDLGVALVPALLLVDREFVVLEVWTGELTASRVEEVARSVFGLNTRGD